MGVLDGKVAIVTGAGQGVGQGIALALAAEGASLTLAGRREKPLNRTLATIEERGGKAQVVSTDVCESSAVQNCVDRTLEAFGTVDILVNNASRFPSVTCSRSPTRTTRPASAPARSRPSGSCGRATSTSRATA